MLNVLTTMREVLTQPIELWRALAVTFCIVITANLLRRAVECLQDWRYENAVAKRMGTRLENEAKNTAEDKVRKAIYAPKQFRGWSGNEPYNPTKHFRREGRTDRKW